MSTDSNDTKAIHRLHKLVTMLRAQSSANAEMSLHHLDVFLLIALTSKLSVKEYADMLEIPITSVSRYVRELGEGQGGTSRPKLGMGLVTAKQSPTDWRKHEVLLTRKGNLLLEQLLEILKGS